MLAGIAAALALVVAIAFLVSSGDDEPSFRDEQERLASDSDAKADARTVQTALETYAIDNDGSYAAATAEDLSLIEPSLSTVDYDLAPETATYAIDVTSETGGTTFTITRNADGSVANECDSPDTGGCESDGSW